MAEAATMEQHEMQAHTEVPGGAEHHEEPTAFGITPGGYVALAMLVVFAIMLWKRVPALIAAASFDRPYAVVGLGACVSSTSPVVSSACAFTLLTNTTRLIGWRPDDSSSRCVPSRFTRQ